MKKFNQKDALRRVIVVKYQLKRNFLKSIVYNRGLPKTIRISASLILEELPKDSSKTRVINRCVLTGRSRSVYRTFKLSRIMIKEFANYGLLPGVVKR